MPSDSPVDPTEKFDEKKMGDVPEGKEEPEGTPIEPSGPDSDEAPDKVSDSLDGAEPGEPESAHVDSPEWDSATSNGTRFSKRKLLFGALVALVVIVVIALVSVCDHEWADTTCTEPRTCVKCGETEGEPLGHDWQEATCIEPKSCARCGETEGEALGHEVGSWTTTTEPTCSEMGAREGVCTRCGETVTAGIPTVDHTPGEWEVTEDYSIQKNGTVVPGTQELKCTVCGAVLETKAYTVELTVSQQNALRTAESYLSFMAFSHSGLVDQLEFEGYSTEDATFAADHCGADWNEQAALCAQNYLDFMGFSRSGLIDQLLYEGFTQEQAEYGVNAVGL